MKNLLARVTQRVGLLANGLRKNQQLPSNAMTGAGFVNYP
ncbi:hypothetical protein J2776_005864 [Paraburkholderia caledonica]|uniref:Uncharacterized protein n=1 Tax=Paraburkholderia caledonica TaxID=134536 RepID=A0ABU1L7I1_9BURK|nr:hypothetical protein [Paraburkholderia caledonica]